MPLSDHRKRQSANLCKVEQDMEANVEQLLLLSQHQSVPLVLHGIAFAILLRTLSFAHTVPLVLKLNHLQDIVANPCLRV